MDHTTKQSRAGGRSYMMRSEKRPGFDGRPPRRKKPRRRLLYKLVTLLLLLLCYPVGLILLWRRTIRWNGFRKLFVSIVSLMLCFVLLSVALLSDFGNPTVKKCQDAVLGVLDKTHEGVQALGERAREDARLAQENWFAVTDNLPGIVAAAGNQAVRGVQALIATPSPEPTASPVPTATPEPTRAPRLLFVREPETYLGNQARYLTDLTLKGDSDWTEADLQPTFTPEPVPSIEPSGSPVAPEPQADTAGGSLTPPPEQTVTANPQEPSSPPTTAPTPTATPTQAPGPTATPAPRMPAAECKVYYTTTGVSYHSSPVCGTMTQGREHTVAEALEAGKQRCRFCEPVPESYADENAWLVWLDARNGWHLTDQCAAIQEEATRMLFTDLADQEGILRACPLCGALQYESELPESVRSRQLDPSLITNGDTLIYFNEQDGYYHASSKCSSNVQLTYTAHKLFEAITEGKEPCPNCQPPEASFD